MKILVATDGSEHALRAVKYAAELVGQLREASSVTLVSVHDDTGLRNAKAYVGSQEVADYLRELSDKELKPARELLDLKGVKHDAEIRTGHVVQQIVDSAEEGNLTSSCSAPKGEGHSRTC